MLRRNPQSGVWERREGETWVPAHNVADGGLDMDVALDDVFSDTSPSDDGTRGSEGEISGGVGAPSAAGTATAADEARQASAGVQAPPEAPVDVVAQDGPDRGPEHPGDSAVDGGGAGVADDDWAIPGLVSTESPRSTGGQRGLRKRLQERIKHKRGAQLPAGSGSKKAGSVKVEVGPRAAKAVGPAVKDSTEARQTRRRVRGAAMVDGKPQRYVSKPPPTLLEARPRWMQDLFEAHFRSESTLVMRRTHNRMKISRTDYAIGWLTLMDKLREDPSIARLKDAKNGA